MDGTCLVIIPQLQILPVNEDVQSVLVCAIGLRKHLEGVARKLIEILDVSGGAGAYLFDTQTKAAVCTR